MSLDLRYNKFHLTLHDEKTVPTVDLSSLRRTKRNGLRWQLAMAQIGGKDLFCWQVNEMITLYIKVR